jgi:hypothetical protein
MMPRLEEVAYYIQGLWLLLKGKPEAFGYLDFSERGFWRSWWAIVFCIPPMLLSWAAFRMVHLSISPTGTATGPDFFAKLGIIELTNWVLPLFIVLIVSRFTGVLQYATAIVIALNWLSIPFQWCYVLVSLMQLLVPAESSTVLVYLMLLMSYVFVTYQIVNRILGGTRMVALAMVLTLFVLPYIVQSQLLSFLGLIEL